MNASYCLTHGRAHLMFCWSKWAGGADGRGKYHVWTSSSYGDFLTGLIAGSQTAVVDDFGNLVRVPS
jgi:hypothetical protein